MKYRKLPKWKYQLLEDETFLDGSILPLVRIETDYIVLHEVGVLTVKKGYAWDGATWASDGNQVKRASLIRDAYCQLISEGYLPLVFRLEADEIFKRICLQDGISKFRAWYMYKFIRVYVKLKYGRKY